MSDKWDIPNESEILNSEIVNSSDEVTDLFYNQDIVMLAKEFLYRTMMAKIEMCKDEPMSDAPPIVLITYETDDKDSDSSGRIGVAPLISESGDVYDALVEVVNNLEIKPFQSIAVILEGYLKGLSDDEVENGIEKGELECDFKNNPFSDVKETVVVSVKDWDSPFHINCVITYTYDDKGLPVYGNPVWGEHELSESDAKMPEVLHKIVDFMKYRINADKADL